MTHRTDECCEKCRYHGMRSHYQCDKHNCLCHNPHTPSSDWEKRLKDLKCVNGAMYFGSVEDDSCDCKTRCQNEQTYEHALEELTAFICTEIANARKEERGRIRKVIEAASLSCGGYKRSSDEAFAHGRALNTVLAAVSNPPSQV